ncbi:unnamed protein product [Schistosoma margrebowiei]|uniref:Uncharacterized protein n=1 Tax=Schistosoma margrebowiei TaxID=48269 RepID=A0A183LR22_9TREM|nr:unnamed protein product [Schistosoma margrebowiei]
MLPVPPSYEKGTPSWSSLKRKSWLQPNSLNCARENVYESHLLKTKKVAEHEPMLLPNCLPHSCVPPVRILKMETLNTTEYQFPLILYNNEMLKENFISPVNKHLYLPKNIKIKKKLASMNNIQLLKLPANCSILPWEYNSNNNDNNSNINKLLSLDEIKSLTKFNSKTMKKFKQQNSVKLNLLKTHFFSNEYDLPNKSNIYQLLKLNQKYPTTNYQLSSNVKLLQLPIERKFHNHKTDNKISNNDNIPSKETYPLNLKNTKDCNSTSNEYTLQILTYPMNNEEQPTLNDISWVLETTKENIKPISVENHNVSQCKFDSPIQTDKKSYNDCGVQFNFVDYGEPNTQICCNTFTKCKNAAWPSDCVEQLLSNDIAHVAKQFLSIHTSDLIDWNNEDKSIVPCVPLHINTSNIYEQNHCNPVTHVNSPDNKQPIEMNNTISPSNIVRNQASLLTKSQIKTVTTTTITNNSSDNKPELLISDLVTAKMLQNSNITNQDNKQSINNEITSLLSCNKQASNYFPLDVVKALSEIDNRLNVIDQVSVQLEQDHKRNQELLETIIQMNKEQSQANPSMQLDEPNKSEATSQQQKLQLPDELNFKGDQLHNQKLIESKINLNVQNQQHDCTIVKQQIKSSKPNERSHSNTGHNTDEREKLRKERREVSMTRRCNEAKQFVNEVSLKYSVLPKQSSPLLDQSIIPKHSNTPIKRGRIQTHSRGTSRVLNQRNFTNNYIIPSSPKPPTLVRFHYNGRSGVTARGARNISGTRRQQTKIVQKSSVLNHPHPDTPKHLTYEDDLQTTILSDWSLESNVKRILYGDEKDRFCSSSRPQSASGISNFDQVSLNKL